MFLVLVGCNKTYYFPNTKGFVYNVNTKQPIESVSIKFIHDDYYETEVSGLYEQINEENEYKTDNLGCFKIKGIKHITVGLLPPPSYFYQMSTHYSWLLSVSKHGHYNDTINVRNLSVNIIDNKLILDTIWLKTKVIK